MNQRWKTVWTCALAGLMLCSLALPSAAMRYEPNAPDAKLPQEFIQAAADYEMAEAVRLGLAPTDLLVGADASATRLEVAAVALTVVAAHYGSDLENFLADCATKRPDAAADTAFRAGAFSDAAEYTAADWALALGITSGTGNGTFSPNTPVTREAAAAFWSKAAALCGVAAGTEGTGAGTYTRGDCLRDALHLYHRAGRTDQPLLTPEDTLARVKTTFSKVEIQKERGSYTVLYGLRGGKNALCAVFADGGARTIPLPAEQLTYISTLTSVGEGRFVDVYGPDGQIYELDLRTGASTAVAADDRTLMAGNTADPSAQPTEETKNEFGEPGQTISMVNDSAAPHVMGPLTMTTLTNETGTWLLHKNDRVLIQMTAARVEGSPLGQSVKVGYIRNGVLTEAEVGTLLDCASFSFTIPEDGAYTFYLRNRSASSIYATSLTLAHYS